MSIERAYHLLLQVCEGHSIHGSHSRALLERGLIERVLARAQEWNGRGYFVQRLRWSYELTSAGREVITLVELGMNYTYTTAAMDAEGEE